jgi:cob(I)alamin adenosyltransferase
MRIYTRTGDKGRTTLVGGRSVPKTHMRIEAYGTIDELMAHVGMIRDMMENGLVKDYLLEILDRLMTCASILASDFVKGEMRLPEIIESDIASLEKAIDDMEASLHPLKSFILPGGHVVSSQCHIARTVCRRAERQIIRLSAKLFVPETVIKYVNRLSDYLFVLARNVLQNFQQKDIPWKPRL